LGLGTQEEIIGKSDFDFAAHDIALPKYEAEQEIIRTGKILELDEHDIGTDAKVTYVSTVKCH
jgi:hypothetical protein